MSRTGKLLINIEPEYDQVIQHIAQKRSMSASSLGRELILEGLRSQGLMTDRLEAAIARGRQLDIGLALRELEEIIGSNHKKLQV